MPPEFSAWLSATKALVQAYPWVFFVLAAVVLLFELRGKLSAKLPDSSGWLRRAGSKALSVGRAALGSVRQVSLSVWLLVLIGVVGMAPWKGCTIPSLPSIPIVSPEPPGQPLSFDGFHVLVLEEGSKRPKWLHDVLYAPAVKAYLDTHCEGGSKGWRVWDTDVPLTNAPANFKEMRAFPQPTLPAINIAVKKRLIQAELPKTEAELLDLLKKYGGA